MNKKSISICCSIMSALLISSSFSLIHAEGPTTDNSCLNQSLAEVQSQEPGSDDTILKNLSDESSYSEEESDSYLDEKTGKVIDPYVKPGMADLYHLNKAIEISYKKSNSFFCSKSKKIFYSKVTDHLFHISDSFKFASRFKPYHENLCNAQVIVTQMQELTNLINVNAKCISWSTRSTALKSMHTYFHAEPIMTGINFDSGEVGADDMVAYLKSHYPDNNSLMNFIQSLANRMEIFQPVIYYS